MSVKIRLMKLTNKDIAFLYGLEIQSVRAIRRIRSDIIDSLEISRSHININDFMKYENLNVNELEDMLKLIEVY